MHSSLELRTAGPPRTRPLTGNPLRMSRPMLSAEALLIDSAGGSGHADHGCRPLGYLFEDWDPGVTELTEIEPGFYDEDTQTWVDREGIITGGVPTRTRMTTIIDWGKWKFDYPTDDVCA